MIDRFTSRSFRRAVAGVFAAVLVALPLAAVQPSRSRPLPERDAAQIRLAIERLNVLGSVLYIAAHPDDENTAMLAWLSKGKLMRTSYLAMTRGDGGQNLIGSEKGDALGVIRTEELLAARQIDGAEQYFTRAIDFGYSKTPEEALSIWGHDAIREDVVRVVRELQPDVIITRFPVAGVVTHGHHTASAILANEAFFAAGDTSVFPDQVREYGAWAPRRIFWNTFSWRPVKENPKLDYLSIDLGAYNPLLGKSYSEIAGESRSMHKSQGFGAAQRRGPQIDKLELLNGPEAKSDPFEGIDTTWKRVPGSEKVAALLKKAAETFDDAHPDRVVPVLLDALAEMNELPDGYWVREKRAELLAVVREASGLWLEAIADAPSTVPGGTMKVNVKVIDRMGVPMKVASVAIPGATTSSPGADLAKNQPWDVSFDVAIPKDKQISQPYWLREPHGLGRFVVKDKSLIGRPENPPAVAAAITISSGGHDLHYSVPVLYRWTDPVKGERYRPVEIEPRATIAFEDPLLVFPVEETKTMRVTVRSAVDALRGDLSLAAPAGWKIEPASVAVAIDGAGKTATETFRVTSPAGESAGELRARLKVGDEVLTRGRETIDYSHIPEQTLFPIAEARIVRADIRIRGKKIGYVMGPGDEVPDALREMGYDVELLSDGDLNRGNLARFSAVVTGVRAFNTRDALRKNLPELLAYVENGGTLVEQYMTLGRGMSPAGPGPYPFEVSHDRVTVEGAPVTFVKSDEPLLTTPNRITEKDFDGWVQERGLYFAHTWDPKYQPVLRMNDPNEAPTEGSLLVASYGEGTFIYTGLSFFRQLPAGVPGAYRLFANLVSAR